MATTSMATCKYTSIITPFSTMLRNNKGTFRLTRSYLTKVSNYSCSSARGIGTERTNCHKLKPFKTLGTIELSCLQLDEPQLS